MKYYSAIILNILIFSCSWNQKEFGSEVLKESAPSVEISNSDPALEESLANEFKVSEEVVIPSPQKVQSSQKQSKSKKVSEKKSKHNTSKETDTSSVAPEEKQASSQFWYPNDYPEDMKKWDIKNKNIWASFTPRENVGEETFLDVSYLGMTIGKIFITVKKNVWVGEKEAHHYYARLKSAPFYSFAYKLDDYVESFVQKENYIPLKFSLIQRESNKAIDNIELFDQKKLMGHLRYKKVQEGKTEKEAKDFILPHLYQDSLSAFFFLRGLPLNVGDTFDFPLSTKDKITIFSVKVTGKETIDTSLGSKRAIKMSATTRYSGEMVEKGQSEIWFSDDQYRVFLKIKAKTKIGAIDASVIEYRSGR